MCLAVLPLQRVIDPLLVVRVNPVPRRAAPLLDLMRIAILDPLLVALRKRLQHNLEVFDQCVTTAAAEIFAHDHSHHLQFLAVRRHGVRRDDPPALAKLMRNAKLVVVEFFARIETEGNERETPAGTFGHDEEAKVGEGFGEVVGRAGEVTVAAPLLVGANRLLLCWGFREGELTA